MVSGWRYRIAGVAGVTVITVLVVTLVNSPTVQALAGNVPVVAGLADTPGGMELAMEVLTATVAFLVAFVPLYKPRPRRILDVVGIAQRRVLLAMVSLAAIGYFDYTYRLPRLTVLLATPPLLVAIPTWFVWIRRRPNTETRRAIVVGDDREQIATVVRETDLPLVGYLSPIRARDVEAEKGSALAVTDGGVSLEWLGGLSRIDDVLIAHDVDTAILAFERTDRAEFFGALDACHEYGVTAKVHRDLADRVLTSEAAIETFVDAEIEPWDVQDHMVKRGFDIAFAAMALVVLAPIVAAIAVAIKLEDDGAILYHQQRTAIFGETFDVYKFRTMIEDAEDETGPVISTEDAGGEDSRITRVGQVLRQTHLDEIPQLWSILRGDMSVVGPRPERPELEEHMELGTAGWRSRWFVKPGLTGLAQISGATGHDPEAKLRYDMEYIRRQSFWFDSKIVVRQVWNVGRDVLETVFESGGRNR